MNDPDDTPGSELALPSRGEVVFPAPGDPGAVFRLPADAEELFRLFLARRAERTRENYTRDWQIFARFVGAASPEEALERLLACSAPEAHVAVVSYQQWLSRVKIHANGQVREGYAPNTIRRRIAALSAVVDFANVLGLVSWRLRPELPRAERKHRRRGVPVAWIRQLRDALVEAAEGSPGELERAVALRDLLIFRLLWESVLRPYEITRLQVPWGVRFDDEEEPSVEVRVKGGSTQWRNLSDEAAADGRRWLAVRGRDRGWLFVNRADLERRLRGEGRATSTPPMARQSINRVLTRWSERVLGKPLYPYQVRRTAITLSIDRVGKRETQLWTQHRSGETLDHYDDADHAQSRAITQWMAGELDAASDDDDAGL